MVSLLSSFHVMHDFLYATHFFPNNQGDCVHVKHRGIRHLVSQGFFLSKTLEIPAPVFSTYLTLSDNQRLSSISCSFLYSYLSFVSGMHISLVTSSLLIGVLFHSVLTDCFIPSSFYLPAS